MVTDIAIPEVDVLGEPTAPYGKTRTEWAVLVDVEINGTPGPHMLGVQSEREARERLAAWRADRPTARARLVCREVFECAGWWTADEEETA